MFEKCCLLYKMYIMRKQSSVMKNLMYKGWNSTV